MTRLEQFQLPLPTDRTVSGPKLRVELPSLVLEYDFERDDGAIEWARVKFNDILAIEFRQNACCEPDHLDAYDSIVRYTDTDWLARLERLRANYLAKDAKDKDGAHYSHWRMYFDDAACVDVVAKSFDAKTI